MKSRGVVAAVACIGVSAFALPASANAITKTVYAGAPPSALGEAVHALGKKNLQRYSPEVTQFFQRRVTINTGDAVSFVLEGFHTVDFPGRSNEDLPLLVKGRTVKGVKDPAGKLFWFDGHVPSVGLNPALFAPPSSTTYDGSTRLDSGIPNGPPKPLKVTFTKPGVYKYFCDIHPGMIGYVVVKPTGASIPSAQQDAQSEAKQVKTVITAAKRLLKRKVATDQVSVGESNGQGLDFLAMVPGKLTVKAGTIVKFSLERGSAETHTVTFGPQSLLKSLSNAFLSKPVATAEGAFPSSRRQPISATPSSHGDGFVNLGLLDRDPTTTIPASGKIKFLKPGVYHFICLIHNNMRGTIVVTK